MRDQRLCFYHEPFYGSAGKNVFFLYKIVPAIKLVLKEKDPRSTLTVYPVQNIFISEDALNFYSDTTISASNDTTILTQIQYR